MLRRYRLEIEHLDAQLGRLVAELEQRGLYDELLIVVTSDHGEEFLDHGGWWHGLTLYDEQIGIPLLVKWPKSRRGAPGRVREQVRSLDITPTLLGFVGAPIPRGMQGDDLLRGARRERVAFAEEDHEGNVLAAIRTRGWKLIRANDDNRRGLETVELYHVVEDPREETNRAELERARTADLLRDVEGLSRLASSEARGSQMVEIGREECERLKALGYVDDCGP
jgi:arylsulfatase A-like enzyme